MVFHDDSRAQSVVIGSLLVFAILILSFSAYQAFSVPNQNAEVEVEHFQDVEDQFSELRTSMINAVGSNQTRSTAIDLGARYPSRVIALNPPPAAGRLETTDPGNVFVSEGGSTVEICRADGNTPTTRSLVYRTGYNEYDEPRAINYESRVIAREFAGGNVSDQRLVRDDEISLYLLTGAVSENGIDTYSLELDGSSQNTMELRNPTITIPSRYDEDTWNDEILVGQSDVTATNNGSQVDLDFTGGDYDVSCAVLGLDSEPEFEPPSDGGNTGNGGNETGENPNPAGPIQLVNASGNSDFDLEFKNYGGESVEAYAARINFVHATGSGNAPTNAVLQEAGSTTLNIGDEFTSLNSNISFATSGRTPVSVNFNDKVGPQGFFIMSMKFDNGRVRQYFVSDGLSTTGGTSTPTSAESIETVKSEGEEINTQSKQVKFKIKNTGSGSVTIVDFAVDATSIDDSIEINDGNNPEFETFRATDDGEADAPGNGNSFLADDTTYRLEDNNGNNATLEASDDDVAVEFRAFENGWIDDSDGLKLVDNKTDADVIIYLGLSDGSTVEIYLQKV